MKDLGSQLLALSSASHSTRNGLDGPCIPGFRKRQPRPDAGNHSQLSCKQAQTSHPIVQKVSKMPARNQHLEPDTSNNESSRRRILVTGHCDTQKIVHNASSAATSPSCGGRGGSRRRNNGRGTRAANPGPGIIRGREVSSGRSLKALLAPAEALALVKQLLGDNISYNQFRSGKKTESIQDKIRPLLRSMHPDRDEKEFRQWIDCILWGEEGMHMLRNDPEVIVYWWSYRRPKEAYLVETDGLLQPPDITEDGKPIKFELRIALRGDYDDMQKCVPGDWALENARHVLEESIFDFLRDCASGSCDDQCSLSLDELIKRYNEEYKPRRQSLYPETVVPDLWRRGQDRGDLKKLLKDMAKKRPEELQMVERERLPCITFSLTTRDSNAGLTPSGVFNGGGDLNEMILAVDGADMPSTVHRIGQQQPSQHDRLAISAKRFAENSSLDGSVEVSGGDWLHSNAESNCSAAKGVWKSRLFPFIAIGSAGATRGDSQPW
eukprot:NODE_1073_length_1723_cov_27.805854_g949_i0.p1 GENE.NODE_1073_length_1723_cov_27.805854_g949_i0~~NODE_1073_length_1723_cov_27.805854_g949_i0.p1  ORF type:complete len:494 (-),score=80.83 NODE_1073_length_1723_cov_27.805854_g949_i0:105-1586(-)